MFRVFGHERIWVLDGGLPRWRASGYDVESSASGDAILKASAASEAIEKVYQGLPVSGQLLANCHCHEDKYFIPTCPSHLPLQFSSDHFLLSPDFQ